MKEFPRTPLGKESNKESRAAMRARLLAAVLAAGPGLAAEAREVTPVHHERVAPVSTPEKVSSEQALLSRIKRAQEHLAPRGAYEKALSDPRLTKEKVAVIVDEFSQIGGGLTRAIIRGASDPLMQNMVLAHETAPSLYMTIPMTEEEERLCNVGYFQEGGITFQATNRHCVAGSSAEKYYFFAPSGPDLAIAEATPPSGIEPLKLPAAGEDMTGRIAVQKSRSREGNVEGYASVLVRTTEPFLSAMFAEGAISPEVQQALLSGYWYVMPPSEGETDTGDAEGHRAKGKSGTLLKTYDAATGTVVAAGVQYMGTRRTVECGNKKTGTCTTIGFAVSPESMRLLANTFNALKNAKTPTPQRVGGLQ